MSRTLTVVFLTGSDKASTRASIEAVAKLPNVRPVGIVVDTNRTTLSRRLQNFRANIRRNGASYVLFRLLEAGRAATDAMVARSVVRGADVSDVLHKAFPDRSFSMRELAAKYGTELIKVPNLNGSEAVAALERLGADLGIVLGARILKRSTFSIPRMGCINLHKGRVPEYRGMPPGFWELYDGASSAGVTVHFVDSGLDTGDVVATSDVPIHALDTPDTLLQKLHREGARTLARAVAAIQRDQYTRQAQPPAAAVKARSKPTRAEVALLRSRLPHWQTRSAAAAIGKNLYSLAIYWSGIYSVVRAWHKWRGTRAAILLYHRVNDYAGDVLTTPTDVFASQLVAISRRYAMTNTESLVDAIAANKGYPATSVAIHFDDCYRDVWTEGAPILKALGLTATFFVNPGYLDTDREFVHDRKRFSFRFENLRSDELREWTRNGFTVGAHTVNHVDLGTCTMEEARTEIVESGRRLGEILDARITWFSFPFGSVHNIRSETANIVMQSDYNALFSAHGGFVNRSTRLSDIPRFGCSGDTVPLYLLLEIEGLAPSQLKKALLRR